MRIYNIKPMCYFSAPTVDHSCGVRLLTRLPPDAPLARCTNNRFGTCCKRRISPACCRKGREHRELHCRRCQNNELHSTEGNGMKRKRQSVPVVRRGIWNLPLQAPPSLDSTASVVHQSICPACSPNVKSVPGYQTNQRV